MARPGRLVNWMIKGCSLAAGAMAFYGFGQELVASTPGLASSTFGYYVIFITDIIVSLIGSAMLAFLFYFCVWDCCVSAFFTHAGKTRQLQKNTSLPQKAQSRGQHGVNSEISLSVDHKKL